MRAYNARQWLKAYLSMALSYSYDLDTTIGQVRLLIGDNPDDTPDTLTGNREGWKCVLADEEITTALTMRSNSLLETASDLLNYIASKKALLAKMLKIGDYSLDTRGLAQELRTQAQALKQQAEEIPAEAVVENYGTQFQAERLITRDLLRNTPGWQDSELP